MKIGAERFTEKIRGSGTASSGFFVFFSFRRVAQSLDFDGSSWVVKKKEARKKVSGVSMQVYISHFSTHINHVGITLIVFFFLFSIKRRASAKTATINNSTSKGDICDAVLQIFNQNSSRSVRVKKSFSFACKSNFTWDARENFGKVLVCDWEFPFCATPNTYTGEKCL